MCACRYVGVDACMHVCVCICVCVCVCACVTSPRWQLEGHAGKRDSREFGCSCGSGLFSAAIRRSRRLKCDSASVVVYSLADSATLRSEDR